MAMKPSPAERAEMKAALASAFESAGVPYGMCSCGCGERTTLAPQTNRRRRWLAGEPTLYLPGHGTRQRPVDPGPNPSGLCMCGCGEMAALARYSDPARGQVVGKPVRYVFGHARRLSPAEYIERDCGYRTPCWVWQRAQAGGDWRGKYAWATVGGGRGALAHRLYYERHVGPIPARFEIHHQCENRLCVNPDHLEALTCTEHKARHN